MATITIPCIGDTYANEGSKNTNYGAASTVKIDGGSNRCHGYWFFDFSNLKYKKIISAEFSVHVASENTSNGTGYTHIYKVSGNGESALTWNNKGEYEEDVLWNKIYYPSGITTGWNVLATKIELGDKLDGHHMVRVYTGNNTGTFSVSSREAGSAAYLKFEYEDIPPNAPTDINPTNEYADSSRIINFSWIHSSDYGGAQTKFDLEWRKAGVSTWNVFTQTTANNYYNMPADTLPEGTIEWRVRTYDQNNIAGPYATGTLYVADYTTTPPNPPKELVPTDIYLDSNKVIKFAWVHSPTYGGLQSKFDLEWRKLSTPTWTVVSQVTANNYYNMPANTLPSGTIEWRVRTYDQNNNASNYSTSKFYSIGAPAKPTIISVKNSCLTEIKWNSGEQDIYELIILKDEEEVYYTGEKAGYNVSSHKPNIFLENGAYTVKIRIRNSYGFYSDFAESIFNISVNKPNKPSLYASISDNGVLISAEFETDKAVLFRVDGERVDMVAVLETENYHDHIVQPGKTYEYFIRAFDSGYEDSEGKTVTVNYHGVKIYPTESKLPVVINKSLDVPYIPRSYSKSNSNNLINYYGRIYPVKEDGGYKSMASAISAYMDKEQKKILSEIYDNNEIVCYLSADEKMYCSITKFNYSNAFLEQGFEVSMEFTRVDYDEEVIVNA